MLNQQDQQKLVNILLSNLAHYYIYIFFQCSNIKIIPVSFFHTILQMRINKDINTQELLFLKQVRLIVTLKLYLLISQRLTLTLATPNSK